MIGPDLQKAIVEVLKLAPPVADGRVFDRVPESDPYPRITVGDEQTADNGNACGDGWEVYADVHVWSRAVGKVEAKQIMAQAVPRLLGISSLTGFTIIAAELDAHRIFTEPDGLTTHGVITIRYVIDPA